MSIAALTQLLHRLRSQTEKLGVLEKVSGELVQIQSLLKNFEDTQSLDIEIQQIKQELAIVKQTQNQLSIEFEHLIQSILY